MANSRLRSGKTLFQSSNETRRSSARLQELIQPALASSEPTDDANLVSEVNQDSASESDFEDPNDSDYSDFTNLDEAQRVTPPWRAPSPIECRTRSFRSNIQKSAPAVGKKPHTPWQKREDKVLISRYAAGHDYEVIRKELRDRDVGAMKRRRLKLQTEELYPGEVFSSGKEWTEEENQKLIRLRNEGQTFTNICLELPGRSAGACQQRFTLVLGSANWEPEEDEQLLASIRDGANLQQIAQGFNNRSATECAYRWEKLNPKNENVRDAAQVRRIGNWPRKSREANRRGVGKRSLKKRWTQKENKKLRLLFDMGETWQAISRQMNRNPRACMMYFRRHFPGLDPHIVPKMHQSLDEDIVRLLKGMAMDKAGAVETEGLVEHGSEAYQSSPKGGNTFEEATANFSRSIEVEGSESDSLGDTSSLTVHSLEMSEIHSQFEDRNEGKVTDKIQEWLEGNQDNASGAASEDSQRPVLSPSFTHVYSNSSSESSDGNDQEEFSIPAQFSLHPSRQVSLARHVLGNFEAQNRKLQMLESDILAHLKKIKPPQAKRGSLPTEKPPAQQQEGGSVAQPAESSSKDRPSTKRILASCVSSESPITNSPPVKKRKVQSACQPSWHEQLIACASDSLSRPDTLKAQSCMGNRELVARIVPEQRSCMANQQLLTPTTSPRKRESRQMKLQSENSTRSNGNAKDQPIEIESDIEEAEDANEIYRRFSISRN